MKLKHLLALCLPIYLAAHPLLAQKRPAQARFDALHYTIDLAVPSLAKRQIHASCTLRLHLKQPGDTLALDLKQLEVTSVRMDSTDLAYAHHHDSLRIALPRRAMPDTVELTVAYHGNPVAPSWFGGFYFTEEYAYNLAVIIDQYPPSFGKAWFPCADNFTDKATYTITVHAPKGMRGVAGGIEEKAWEDGEGHHSRWNIRQQVPTYLVAVAVGQYQLVADTWKNASGQQVPIGIYVLPRYADKVKGSFANLKKALTVFEERYGPYLWDRVGYVGVPMKGGAMEHAMNIAYPSSKIDGTTEDESLWAHELAHSWFGNLVTCASPAEMWLNEGFARYSETIFYEGVYGADAALAYNRETIRTAIQLSAGKGMRTTLGRAPNHSVYSSTVYDKGAAVIHTLRNHIGSEDFFEGLKLYMDIYKYKNATAADLRKCLEETSKQQLGPFFDAWVYQPGLPLYTLDTWYASKKGSGYTVDMTLLQDTAGRNTYAPCSLQVLALHTSGETELHTVYMPAQASQKTQIQLPWEPVALFLDPFEATADAALDMMLTPQNTGPIPGLRDMVQLEIDVLAKGSGQAVLQPRYVWGKPSYSANEDMADLVAPYTYWQWQGVWSKDFDATVTLHMRYRDLFDSSEVNERSAGLYYRESAAKPWELMSPLGGLDRYDIANPPPGDYAVFAKKREPAAE